MLNRTSLKTLEEIVDSGSAVHADLGRLAGIRADAAAEDPAARIDLFSTDAAKHKPQLQQDLATAAPFLAPGRCGVHTCTCTRLA